MQSNENTKETDISRLKFTQNTIEDILICVCNFTAEEMKKKKSVRSIDGCEMLLNIFLFVH